MTLRESLIEHYTPHPENLPYGAVKVNGYVSTAWDADVELCDVVSVDYPHIGIRTWIVGGMPPEPKEKL